jgi:beta-glucosidase
MSTLGYARPSLFTGVRILIVAFFIGACDSSTPPLREPVEGGVAEAGCSGPSCRLDSNIEARIDSVLSKMTLEEKIDQKHGGSVPPAEGGFNATVHGLYVTPELPRLGIPGFKMVDGARGVGAGTGNATAFPVASLRAATWDPDLEQRVGEAIGLECAAKGGNVILAPVLNNLRHPRWGRSQETYGEDTYLLGRMGVGFVKGAQQHVLASAKHYAANSIENSRFTVNVVMDERTLREVYLPHFKAVVEEANVASIMSSYNKVNGFYAGENQHLLSDILKGDWGFEGFVESDWIFGTRSTVPSALAGLDIEMPEAEFFGKPLFEAVQGDSDAGSVPTSVIDASVRRILRRKFEYKLDDPPPQPPASVIESAEHEALALEVAEKGIVLLKNDAGALPLDRSKVHSIAVVGQLAGVANIGDHGSSSVAPSVTITPLAGIQQAANGVTITPVPNDTPTDADVANIAAADAAVVVVGLTFADEGEFLIVSPVGDRTSLELSAAHIALIEKVAAANPRTIVVLEGGSALTVEGWIDGVKGLLHAFYPGSQGGAAIAAILFGDVNPSGKLPVTTPVSEAQLPPFDNTSDQVTYDYFHGYRYVDHNGDTPRFPFGFGMSYTTFSYANIKLSSTKLAPNGTVTVSADVTNSGSIAGDEIVELYASAQGSSVERAVRDLKGFSRVHLDAGQTQTVTFSLKAQELAYYDTSRSTWVVEPIDYVLSVGPSSRTLPLMATVTVR